MTLPPDTESPRRARHFVRDVLVDPQVATDLEVVALLVSEVVTNAVLHARSDVTVTVRCDATTVRVEVTDHSSAAPVTQHLSEEAMTGRGMILVETLADAWGTAPSSEGKVVWFELAAA